MERMATVDDERVDSVTSMPSTGPLRRAGRRLRRPRSVGLRTRTSAAAALLALGVTASMSMISYEMVRAYLLNQRETLTARQAYANARLVRDALRNPDVDIADLLDSLRSDSGSVALMHWRGEWFTSGVGTDFEDLPNSLRALVDQGESARQRFKRNGVPQIVVAVRVAAVEADYVEIFPLDTLERNLEVLALSLLAGSSVTVAGGALLGHRMSRQVLSPVRRVAGAAEALAHGGLDTRLEDELDPDLQRLVRSFNDMADSIQTRIEREARFASDVSHELRTPLAALAAAADVLNRRRDELSDRGRQALDVMSNQIERFTTMVLDLLEISRMDSGTADVNIESVSLPWLLHRIVDGTGRVGVEVVIPPALRERNAPLDRRRFEQMLTNLIDNALRYGATAVVVSLEAGPAGTTLVHVDDDGPGVAPEERTVIFDRFTRGGSSAGTTGTGLGLALVQEHARLQRATVTVTDSPVGGARFTVALPPEQA